MELTKVQAWPVGAPQQSVRMVTLELSQGHQLLGWEGVQDRGLPLLGSPCMGSKSLCDQALLSCTASLPVFGQPRKVDVSV